MGEGGLMGIIGGMTARFLANSGILWTPTTSTIWHNAGDPATLTTVSGAASQLNDKSGSAHWIQASPTQRPIVTPNGLNGKTVLTLDGVNDFMSSSSAGQATNISIIVLMKYNSASGEDIALGFGTTGQTKAVRALYRGNGGTTQGFATFGNDITSSGLSCDIGGDFHIFSIIQSGQQVSMWRDGSPDTVLPRTLSLTPNTVNTTNYTLGSLAGPSIGAYYSAISFCEAVVYYSAINSTLRQHTEGYMAHDWGKQGSLPSDHPYKNAPPYV